MVDKSKDLNVVPIREARGPFGNFQYLSDVPDLIDVRKEQDRALHVVLLADDMHPANVVQDHINSIAELSDNVVTVLNPRLYDSPTVLDHSRIDALILHYSVFAISDDYLTRSWKVFMRDFDGIKAMIHEDEYQQVIRFREFMSYVGFHAVFSCLDSPETLEKVYGAPELASTSFFSCLPGYIPDYLDGMVGRPQSDRATHIVYRGRNLLPQLGRFAQEKRWIGEQVSGLAEEAGLKFDISSSEADRIYGPEWNRFLQKGRAMLGVEGGASIFDFNGVLAEKVEAYKTEHPGAEFEEIWDLLLRDDEGNVEFRVITPKFFEAIASKTALLLYPGRYSGVLEAESHYIQLERDGSNFADVAKKLCDTQYLQQLVDNAHEEIMGRSDLRARYYVRKIDQVLLQTRSARKSDSPPFGKILGGSDRQVKPEMILSGPSAVLRRRINVAEKNLVELSDQIKNFPLSHLELREQQLSAEISAMRELQTAHQTQINETLQAFQTQDNALSEGLGEIQALVNQERSRVELLQTGLGDLRADVAPQVDALDAREQQITEEVSRIRELQSAHQTQINETLEAFQTQDNALSKGLGELQALVNQERSRIESLQTGLGDLRGEVSPQITDLDSREQKLSEEISRIRDLQVAHQTQINATLGAFQTQDNALSKGLGGLQALVNQERSRVELLQTGLGDLRADVSPQITDLDSREQQLSEEISKIRELQSAHQTQINETLKAFEIQDKALSEGLEDLRADVSPQITDLDSREQKLSEEISRIRELQSAHQTQINETLKAFEIQDKALSEGLEDLRREVSPQITDLDSREQKLSEEISRIRELQSAHQTQINATLEAFETQDKALSKGLGELQALVQQERSQNAYDHILIESLKSSLGDLRSEVSPQIGDLQEVVGRARSQIELLQRGLGDLRSEVSPQIGDLDAREQQLSEEIAQLKSLQSEHQNQTDNLDVLSKRYDHQITLLQQTVAGEISRLSEIAAESLAHGGRMEELEALLKQEAQDLNNRVVEESLAHNGRMDELEALLKQEAQYLNDRVIRVELQGRQYRQWQLENTVRLSGFESSIEHMSQSIDEIIEMTGNYDRTYVQWKHSLKKRILKRLWPFEKSNKRDGVT